MKKLILVLLALISFNSLFAQGLDLEKYKQFLEDNKGISGEKLKTDYPVGLYQAKCGILNDIMYLSEIQSKYSLTQYENSLIDKHNFVVTERQKFVSLKDGLESIWINDLPLFLSTDALLHVLHIAYDAILKDLELTYIIPQLEKALLSMKNYTPNLSKKYKKDTLLLKSVKDFDLYITIALNLLTENYYPLLYSENKTTYNLIMSEIQKESLVDIKLFSSTTKSIDFSQFTVRGHYTDLTQLAQYFKAMMWLGRIELYLIPPQPASENPQSPEDIQRQIIDSYMLLEAAENSNSMDIINRIDNIIKTLVGESDNVTFKNLKELKTECSINDLSYFNDMANVKTFQNVLSKKQYSDQKILSQAIWYDPFNTDSIKPASSYLFLGQRFIIDSYITGNVVMDKVKDRVLPSIYDVLFALGNNAASDFLTADLNIYQYADKLAGLRYLVDSYGKDFWNLSYYNGWLAAIRTLNPPNDDERKKLPPFMQTAAWWQEKMNTQLSSWTELRHDNLLYAKQSYSGEPMCSYPEVYVEPIPEFYKTLALLADNALTKISTLDFGETTVELQEKIDSIKNYFPKLKEYSLQLADIAEKELAQETITSKQKSFLQDAYKLGKLGCGVGPAGWLFDLCYSKELDKVDFIVADIHTAPTDEYGSIMGYVKHIGTGYMNLAVVVAPNNEGKNIAYAGPVMSFYEYTSLNFDRLTDEEWFKMIYASSTEITRPELTELYMANGKGEEYTYNPFSLPVGVNDKPVSSDKNILVKTYPNPCKDFVFISFDIPSNYSKQKASLKIYDVNGNYINTLYEGDILSGDNHTAIWRGVNTQGQAVQSGIYIYELVLNNNIYSGKINLVK